MFKKLEKKAPVAQPKAEEVKVEVPEIHSTNEGPCLLCFQSLKGCEGKHVVVELKDDVMLNGILYRCSDSGSRRRHLLPENSWHTYKSAVKE